MITSDEIEKRLWNGANELRGSMDASRYKDYMLGLMFYKFLSDKTLSEFAKNFDKTLVGDAALDAYAKAFVDYDQTQIKKMLQKTLGYFVEPEHLYHSWVRDINNGKFEVKKVTESLNSFERNIASSDTENDFKGLFSSSNLDLNDNAFGEKLNDRNKSIKALILLFADLNMVDLQKSDILGDAYEFLIKKFALESGKKAGEFYTPRQVSEVIAQIVSKSSNISSIYDPTVGSGSLLLTVSSHLTKEQQKALNYYGQEKNTSTYNLTRMNLLLHGVLPTKMDIRNADTLDADWPDDPTKPGEGVQFDAVVMNPPYSAKNWNKSNLKPSDPRFETVGILPPDNKGDYAFLLHGLYHLNTNGTMGIVLPHGVLFRGAAEGEIRKRLIERNYIDTIIGLPSNLFTNTGIPVAVIILKKNRALNEPLLFIDASNGFTKEGKNNVLQEKDIEKIVDVYCNKEEITGYSKLVSLSTIKDNDFNLNIPRYVENVYEEIQQDVDAHLLGGIPKADIDNLKVINSIVPNILNNSLENIRNGYVQLKKNASDIFNEIFADNRVVSLKNEIIEKTNKYINEYWECLKIANGETKTNVIKEKMFSDIKNLFEDYFFIDKYDAFQLIATIWNDYLDKDIEFIKDADFYTASRTRIPKMVTNKSKVEIQDGWTGLIIPNDLIEKLLFKDELEIINEKGITLQEIESEILEIATSAKIEDTEEYDVLNELIKKDSNDELTNDFDSKLVKKSLKNLDKDSSDYQLMKKVDDLINKKSSFSKEIKKATIQLKNDVQDRIPNLTNEEIDQLVYEKWFGKVIVQVDELVHKPLKKELDILKMLQDRYSDTLSNLDNQLDALLKEFESMNSELVRL